MSGSVWSWKPAFNAVVSQGPLATPAAPVGFRINFAGILVGNHTYQVAAAFDGAGLLGRTIAGPGVLVTTGGFPYGVVLNIVAVPGATSYRVFRDGFLVAVTSQLAIFDSGQATLAEAAPLIAGPSSYLVDMAPVMPGVGPRPAWLERSKARVVSVEYSDLADPDAYKSVRRSLLAKEFGCRPTVEMMFQVEAGSVEDQQVVALWDWKMAFPDGTSPGVRLFFTLTSANPLAPFVEVRVVGPLRREPTNEKNVLVVNSWRIMQVEPSPSVPDLSFNINGAGWWT